MKRKILFIEILAIVLSMCSPNPVPVINLLSPDSKVYHMPEFTLTVTGSGFVEQSQIVFNGTAKITTFVSGTELNCQVYPDDIPTGPASILVSVTSPSPGGGDSNELTFNVCANHSFTTPLQLTNFIIVDPVICREAVADVGIDVSLDDSIHLVIGQGHYLSDYGPGTGDIYFTHSQDGGDNWNSLQILPVPYAYLPDIASIYECIFGIFYKVPWAAGHASDLWFVKTEDCGDSWTSPLDMTPDAFTERFQYKLITDQSKNFHLVYRDSNYGYIPNNWQIAYRQSNDGGTTWSGPFNVSNNLTQTHVIFPNINVEESGAILVVWSWEEADVYNIKCSRSIDSGVTWSVPVELSNSDSSSLSPHIAVDNAGYIHVVWIEDGEEVTYSRSLDNGITWSTPVMITPVQSREVQIVADSALNLNVVLHTQFPSYRLRYLRSIDKGFTWTPTVLISPANEGCIYHFEQNQIYEMDCDSLGNIYLIFRNNNQAFFCRSVE